MAKKKSLGDIVGAVDHVSPREVRGWAFRQAKKAPPVELFVKIDGMALPSVCAELERPDVSGAGLGRTRVGFRISIPGQFQDGLSHRIEFFEINGGPLALWQPSSAQHANHCQLPAETQPIFPVSAVASSPDRAVPADIAILGFVDGLQDGAIRGWVIARHLSDNRMQAGLQVLVTLQGHPVAQVTASQMRVDVAEALGCDPNCGFSFVPAPEYFAGKAVDLVFKVIPGGLEVPGSPYSVTFPDFDVYKKIRAIGREIDQLFVQLWQLRSNVKGLLPATQHNLQSYHQWAAGYFESLEDRPPDAGLPRKKTSQPLISIVCPTYRPRLRDFRAAIESVLGQSYANWELIIVDDASDSAELAECIRDFTKRDSRVISLNRKKNAGISVATNDALAVARGRYIAFFDHDDLLVDRAIEIMVGEALRTGAQLLYCDEDKIDDSGFLAEVSLKPDWNYRLLLSQNYLCHLLFVDKQVLDQVGPLRREYDGAQDHDLVLRLAEVLPAEKIHHVAEVLYHWRKTPSSTSGLEKSKPYTVKAGIQAITDHLKRSGKAAQVSSPRGITYYQVNWILQRQPKVSIIIPYREHTGMTRACLDAVIANTDYSDYEILLVDNWSTSDEALAFADEISHRKGVRVLRVQEPFNFSRINNLAVAEASGEFLLFMNNDVMVSQPSWLSQMVGEALADNSVAAVGNKLLYPSGKVQHAGVILGVGGVADHAHRGLEADAAGYMARAVCAQELSAVTAACMLCRKAAFLEVGGFDEIELQVAYNDVDLCLKLRDAGYRVVWTPLSVAEHRESLSRGDDFKPEHQLRFYHENQVMQSRWKKVLERDPSYNKNFSRRSGIFLDLQGQYE